MVRGALARRSSCPSDPPDLAPAPCRGLAAGVVREDRRSAVVRITRENHAQAPARAHLCPARQLLGPGPGDGPRPGRFRTPGWPPVRPRSMAQGLVTPGISGSFHGGLDLSHESGWYIGNWTSNLDPGKPTEIDSYAGLSAR
ncbi:TorF family putative porin [Klebsiella pneumoniae]